MHSPRASSSLTQLFKLSGSWQLGQPAAYEPNRNYTLAITGPSYAGIVIFVDHTSEGASLAVAAQPSGGSFEPGPLCTGKSTFAHGERAVKTGGSFIFHAPSSGTVRLVAFLLGSRAGPSCNYEVIDVTLPPVGAPTTTTTTTTTAATTTTATTTAATVATTTATSLSTAVSTTAPEPSLSTRQTFPEETLGNPCAICVVDGLFDPGDKGTPRWCVCCANDCEGIRSDCREAGFCGRFCPGLSVCAAPTTASVIQSSSTAAASMSQTVTELQVSPTNNAGRARLLVGAIAASTMLICTGR